MSNDALDRIIRAKKPVVPKRTDPIMPSSDEPNQPTESSNFSESIPPQRVEKRPTESQPSLDTTTRRGITISDRVYDYLVEPDKNAKLIFRAAVEAAAALIEQQGLTQEFRTQTLAHLEELKRQNERQRRQSFLKNLREFEDG
jgi:hypothetical protein